LAVKNPTSLDKFAANNRAATKTTTRRHKGHEQSLVKSGEEKGLDVGLGLGSTSLPAMTYRHTYTAAGAELMKGDECASLVAFLISYFLSTGNKEAHANCQVRSGIEWRPF